MESQKALMTRKQLRETGRSDGARAPRWRRAGRANNYRRAPTCSRETDLRERHL
jgi:hypothetical protein